MGFAITPESPKEGVYYMPAADQYIVVENVIWLFGADIWYKKGQKKSKLASNRIFSELIYIGEFNEKREL